MLANHALTPGTPAVLAAYITVPAANGTRYVLLLTPGTFSAVTLILTCFYPLFAATSTSPTSAICRSHGQRPTPRPLTKSTWRDYAFVWGPLIRLQLFGPA